MLEELLTQARDALDRALAYLAAQAERPVDTTSPEPLPPTEASPSSTEPLPSSSEPPAGFEAGPTSSTDAPTSSDVEQVETTAPVTVLPLAPTGQDVAPFIPAGAEPPVPPEAEGLGASGGVPSVGEV